MHVRVFYFTLFVVYLTTLSVTQTIQLIGSNDRTINKQGFGKDMEERRLWTNVLIQNLPNTKQKCQLFNCDSALGEYG
jgi:hypothetical protein